MDPITAIGTAGSVVGIASFGLQLSQTLYQFISSCRGASASVRAVLDGLNATTGAMHQIRDLLRDEKKRTSRGQKASLFSTKALEDIKGIVDQCLVIFWRIEAIISNKPDSKPLDQEIARNLVIFNDEIEAKQPSKLLKLDSMVVLTKMQSLRWPYVSPRLKEYGQQLNSLQVNLILIFQIMSLASMRTKTNASQPKPADFKVIHELYTRIEQTANQADLGDLNTRYGHHIPSMGGRSTREKERSLSRSRMNNGTRRGSVPDAPHKKSTQRRTQAPSILDDSDEYYNEKAKDPCTPFHIAGWKPEGNCQGMAPGLLSELPTSTKMKVQFDQEMKSRRDRHVTINSPPYSGKKDSRVVFNINNNVGQREHAASETLIDLDTSEASATEELDLPKASATGPFSADAAKSWEFDPILLEPADQSDIVDFNKSNYRRPYITDLGNNDLDVFKDDAKVASELIEEPEGNENISLQLASAPPSRTECDGGLQILSPSQQEIQSQTIIRHDQSPINSLPHFVGGLHPVPKQPPPSASPTRSSANMEYPSTVHNEEFIDAANADVLKGSFATTIKNPTLRTSVEKTGDLNKSNLSLQLVPSSSLGSSFNIGLKSIFGRSKENEDIGMDQYDTAHLSAYIIKDGASFEVPYTGLLQIKQARTKGFLTSSWNQSWWKTFAFLCEEEMMAVQNAVGIAEDDEHRTLVHLERIKKTSMKFWSTSGSTLLAIVRTIQGNSGKNTIHSGSMAFSNSVAVKITAPLPTKGDESIQHQQKRDISAYLSQAAVRNFLSRPQAKKIVHSSQGTNEFAQKKFTAPTLKPSLENITSERMADPEASYLDPMDIEIDMQAKSTYAMYRISKIDAKTAREEDWWENCLITREILPDWDILEHLEKIDKIGPSLIQKKARLKTYQNEQIMYLIQAHNDALPKARTSFEWTLAQLQFSVSNHPGKQKEQQLPFLTVILRRAPISYNGDGRVKEEVEKSDRNTAPRLASKFPPSSQQLTATTQKGDFKNQPAPLQTSEVAYSKQKKKKRKKRKEENQNENHNSDGDISSDTTSIIEDERMTAGNLRLQERFADSRSEDRRSRRLKNPLRTSVVNKESTVLNSRNPRMARHSISHGGSKKDAVSDRFAYPNRRVSLQETSRQSDMFGDIGEPTYKGRKNSAPHSVHMNLPRDHTAIITSQYSGYHTEREEHDSSASHDSLDLPADFRRKKSSDYPKHYDKKPYNARVRQNTGGSREKSSTDIVEKLLLKWIVSDSEEQEKSHSTSDHDGTFSQPGRSHLIDDIDETSTHENSDGVPSLDHFQNRNRSSSVAGGRRSSYPISPSPLTRPPSSTMASRSSTLESLDDDEDEELPSTFYQGFEPTGSRPPPSPIRLRPNPSSLAPAESFAGGRKEDFAPQNSHTGSFMNERVVSGHPPLFGSSMQGLSSQHVEYPEYSNSAATAPLQPRNFAFAPDPILDPNALPGDYIYRQYNPFAPATQPLVQQPESFWPNIVPHRPQMYTRNVPIPAEYWHPSQQGQPPPILAPQPHRYAPNPPNDYNGFT